MKLLQYFLILLPYKITTISSPRSKSEVIDRLSDYFIPEAVVGEDNFWNSASRYVGHDLSNQTSIEAPYHFQIDGPFGYKKWTLSTKIKIAPTDQGSILKLRLTLSLFTLFCAIVGFGFYGIVSIFVMKFPFWQIIILQELFLYSIVIFIFNYEVEALIKLLRDCLENPV